MQSVMKQFDEERKRRRTKQTHILRDERILLQVKKEIKSLKILRAEKQVPSEIEIKILPKIETPLDAARAESLELQRQGANAIEKRAQRRLSKLKKPYR